MGIFDEGCMGMYNAIIDDELLNPAGIFKERLSQSALVAKMRTVSQAEAEAVYNWLVAKGVKFDLRRGLGDRADAGAGASSSARCTSRRCASPRTLAATPSASSISRD